MFHLKQLEFLVLSESCVIRLLCVSGAVGRAVSSAGWFGGRGTSSSSVVWLYYSSQSVAPPSHYFVGSAAIRLVLK